MSLLVLLWAAGPVRHVLQRLDISFPWPLLDGRILRAPAVPRDALPGAVLFCRVSSPGTAIFLSGVLSCSCCPAWGSARSSSAWDAPSQPASTIATVCLVLATAYVMNFSGMNSSLGLALAATGALFPLFSPFLGWLGVAALGLRHLLQRPFWSLSAHHGGTPGAEPGAMAVAGNATGGVAGKMISPQSISVATVSATLPRQEGALFRSTIGHSVAMALIVSITMVQAYLLPGMPAIEKRGRGCSTPPNANSLTFQGTDLSSLTPVDLLKTEKGALNDHARGACRQPGLFPCRAVRAGKQDHPLGPQGGGLKRLPWRQRTRSTGPWRPLSDRASARTCSRPTGKRSTASWSPCRTSGRSAASPMPSSLAGLDVPVLCTRSPMSRDG